MISGKKIWSIPFWILLIGVLFLSTAYANNQDDNPSIHREKIDSLLGRLPQADHTERFHILSKLSTIYLAISMESSNAYARQALEIAKQGNKPDELAQAYKQLGNIALQKGQYPLVTSFYDSSLIYFSSLNDTNGESKVWNNLGILYRNIGDLHTSIDFHMKSLYAKKQLNDSLGLANSYNNIGSIYFEIHDLDKAYKYYQQALEIFSKLGNNYNSIGVFNNLGLINQELGQQSQALEYFNKAIDLATKMEDVAALADAYHNIGTLNMDLGNFDESLKNYKKSLELSDQLGIKNCASLNNIGQVYIELDYYREAIKYLNKALSCALVNHQFLFISEIYNNRAIAFERLKEYDHALADYKQFKIYNDSLSIQIFNNQVSEISNKHELEKSREEVEKIKLKIENQQVKLDRHNILLYLGGAIAAILFIVALIFFRLMRQKGIMNKTLVQQNNEAARSQEIIKKINIALTEKEEKLRSIFDVSPYAIFVLDSNNIINDCNDTSVNLFHAKKKRELLDNAFSKFLSDTKDKSALFDYFEENKLSHTQLSLKRCDDTLFQASITGRTIQDSEGKVSARVIVVNDITERLQFIESLKEAKLKAEESDRLKTAFLANMSHEIRTPMNAIIGFSHLLNESDIEEERKKEFLEHILHSSSLLLDLIDDIIDISKIEAGQLKFHKEVFQVNDLIRKTFNPFKDTNINPKLEYIIHLPDDSENIHCNSDPVRLRQILTNLLSNASKFTSQGSIELSYEINKLNQPPKLEFCIRDTGIGIPANMHELVFERFRQVDDSQSRKFGGTGLGLAITKKLVEMSGGSIHLESEPGKGAAFYFSIPYTVNALPINPRKKITQSAKYNWQNKTMLIAEDENSNYELLRAMLKDTGINTIWAHDGKEAVEFMRSKIKVDLILMDIRMPRMNGYEPTRQIKALIPDIPIIATTAYAMDEDEAKSKLAGCDSYLSKPIRSESLFPQIDIFLQENPQGRNQP